MSPRRKPYTEIGIRRLKCIRCGAKASTQWHVCADGNIYRPVCWKCDIEINAIVLAFMHIPNWKMKLRAYEYHNKEEAPPKRGRGCYRILQGTGRSQSIIPLGVKGGKNWSHGAVMPSARRNKETDRLSPSTCVPKYPIKRKSPAEAGLRAVMVRIAPSATT